METSGMCPWLCQEDFWRHLTPDSQRAVATAAALRDALATIRDADWSPVVTLVFKAFEIEVLVRVLRPFRTHLQTTLSAGALDSLCSDLDRKEWSRPFGRFLSGGRPPALGETMQVFARLGDIATDTPSSALAALKRWLRVRMPRAHRLWGPSHVAGKMHSAVIGLRNRYVHERVVCADEIDRALERLWGQPNRAGVLTQALRVISHGMPHPNAAAQPCNVCGAAKWHYPLRDPEYYCEGCPMLVESPASTRCHETN